MTGVTVIRQDRPDPRLEKLGPIGVLLLVELPESGDWDVSYMGIVPEARRRGFAREMLLRALVEAKSADVLNISLSVDARNLPAMQLYRSMGFEAYDRREIYLHIFSH